MADDAKEIMKALQDGSLTKDDSKGKQDALSKVRYRVPINESKLHRRENRNDSMEYVYQKCLSEIKEKPSQKGTTKTKSKK